MKLLQIAYYYPPMGGAGVQRSLKFSKFLGEFGIRPVVLAAYDPAYTADASLLADVPAGLPVHRIEHRALLQRLVAWRAGRRTVPAEPHAPTSTTLRAPASASPGWRDRALAAYASLYFPDDKAGWARRAYAQARQLVHDEGIELIFSSAPPMSVHALAARLAHDCGLPWVADFRDLWTDNPAYAAPAWRRALDRRTEARWLAGAAGIVTVTPTLQQVLRQRVAPCCPVALIPNGYDEADFAAVEPVPREAGRCRVVHAGTLYGHQSPRALLEAAAALLMREPALAERLRLRFVGLVGERLEPLLAAFAARFPGVLERSGFVEHRRAVAEMLGADLLLLVIGGGLAARGVLSGKVFEYLRVGTPVLLIGPSDGDAAALLRAHARCAVADEADSAAIGAALAAALAGRVPALPPGAAPAEFERRALTHKLAEFLQQCRDHAHG